MFLSCSMFEGRVVLFPHVYTHTHTHTHAHANKNAVIFPHSTFVTFQDYQRKGDAMVILPA